MAMTEQYGDYEISYNEATDKWEGRRGNQVVSRSLRKSALLNRLDKIDAAESVFERVSVFKLPRLGEGVVYGEITSVVPETKDVWVTWQQGAKKIRKLMRYRDALQAVYVVTDANKELLVEWERLEQARKSAQKRRDAVRAKMKRYTLTG
jgi:hypothetical protein